MFPTDNVISLLWPFRYPSDTLASEFSEHLTLTTPSPGPGLVSAVTSNHNHIQPTTAGLRLLPASLPRCQGAPWVPRISRPRIPSVSWPPLWMPFHPLPFLFHPPHALLRPFSLLVDDLGSYCSEKIETTRSKL